MQANKVNEVSTSQPIPSRAFSSNLPRNVDNNFGTDTEMALGRSQNPSRALLRVVTLMY